MVVLLDAPKATFEKYSHASQEANMCKRSYKIQQLERKKTNKRSWSSNYVSESREGKNYWKKKKWETFKVQRVQDPEKSLFDGNNQLLIIMQ